MTKKEKRNYLASWHLGVFIVSTCKTKEELISKILNKEGDLRSFMDIYKDIHYEPWGQADALLSAFGI